MRHFTGLVLAGGLWLGLADESKAQYAYPVGTPYYGQAYRVAAPAYAYPAYGNSYGRRYVGSYPANVIAGPGYANYSSGYSGYVRNPNTGYQTLNHYYGAYGYGNYGYGSRDGFRPVARFR